jgi:hypothetical protein
MKEQYSKPVSDVLEFSVISVLTASEPTDDNHVEWGQEASSTKYFGE